MADYVLTGYTGKALEKQLSKIDTNSAEIAVLKANCLTSVPEATRSSLGGVKISGSITSSNPSESYGVVNMANGMIYVPLAKWDMNGTNTPGVISGEDRHKIQYANEMLANLVSGDQPLKIEEDYNRGYFIGLWQDGNTYKGGYVPLATEGKMGLLAGEFQPYLVSLRNLYESGDVMEEELSDMASDKELKQVEKDVAGLSEKVKNLPSVDTSKLATTASLNKTRRFCVLPFSWLMEFGSNVPTIEGVGIAGSGSTTVYFSRNAKLFLIPSGMMRYYSAWGDGFDNVLDSQSYENANLFLCTDDNTVYRRKDDGSLVAVSASEVEGLQTDMADLIPRVNTIEKEYLTEVHIGGEPLEKDGEHSVNLPYAYFSLNGENADGVISGDDWRKFQYAYSMTEQLVGANSVQPLKIEEDYNRGYFIGLWQDGNTYKGGYIPLATEGKMGLLAGEFQPYLVALWELYADSEEMIESLRGVNATEISSIKVNVNEVIETLKGMQTKLEAMQSTLDELKNSTLITK